MIKTALVLGEKVLVLIGQHNWARFMICYEWMNVIPHRTVGLLLLVSLPMFSSQYYSVDMHVSEAEIYDIQPNGDNINV